jgi:hypothetical protein
MNVNDYAERLLQETISAADAEAAGALRAEVFTRLVTDRLTAAGEINDAEIAFHKARGVEVSGWSLDDDDDAPVLHLFVTDYRGAVPPPSLSNTAIDESFRRLGEFFDRSLDGYADRLEESTPAFELADMIYRKGKSFDRIRLYLLSDARARAPTTKGEAVRGIPVSRQVWDIERLRRLDTSGLEHEPITVDVVERIGGPLPCLVGPAGRDHQVLLTILPGQFLASLYDEFGARLLERNVRAFLQARGAVNKGIRDTLLSQPDHFLAYNNGISATASEVKLVESGDGGTAISLIKDLQIVNGGQTTASIQSVNKKADIGAVAVQAKLTVVPRDRIERIVPSISKFSNTQNRVTGADFSANHPFHARLEELSRTVWAPTADGSQRQTHWFYERARGQYADELQRSGTPARRKQFRLTHPPQQRFTKTDLAKFENSWDQHPHVVSLGAEKNFREYMLALDRRGYVEPDVAYFHRVVAKAILFRTTERVVSAQKFGGYRANIVTYVIAKLVHATSHRIDLEAVWRHQVLTETLQSAIGDLAKPIFVIITNPAGRVRHIGEWCKKIDC